MATSEHTNQVEIPASGAHSQGQRRRLSASETLVNVSPPKKRVRTTSSSELPTAIIDDNNQLPCATNISQRQGQGPSESTTQYTPHHQPPQNPPSVIQGTEVTTFERRSTPGMPLESSAVSFSEHDLPYELPPHGNISIQEDTGSRQPTPPEVTGEPHGIANTLSSAVDTGTSEQSSREGLLEDIFLECSSPRRFNDELTLAIKQSGNFKTLRLTKISPTKWKAIENIDLSSRHDAGYMMLIVQSKDGGDEAFLVFTAYEIYAMACAKKDTPAVFASTKEDNPMAVKMTFTVASSSPFESGAMNYARGVALGAISDLRNAVTSAQTFLRRFEETGNVDDITQVIFHYETAVSSMPGINILPAISYNLGNSYLDRFQRTGDLQDIELAISHHQNTVQSTRSGHADLLSPFNNLRTSYARRFECTGDLQDIDRAISHHQTAVGSTPSGCVDLPLCLKNLGKSYRHGFQCTHDFPDILNSAASYCRAVEANGIPSIRLQCAILAATISLVYDESHCLNDFARAISLLSEVTGLEQTIHRHHANHHDYFDLVGSVVATALCFNKADLALEWLEQGRCLVWNQLNQLRTPIGNLRIKNPSLANGFIQVAGALESYGIRSALSIPSSHATLAEDIRLQDATRNHTIHATEYTQLLKEIRDLPAFHVVLPQLGLARLSSASAILGTMWLRS